MKLNRIPFANDIITVYNKHTKTDESGKVSTHWTHYVLTDAIYKKSGGIKIDGKVTVSNDETVAKAPNDTDYIPYPFWRGQSGKFTAGTGDVIVWGRAEVDIPVNGSVINEIRKTCPNIGEICFTAKTVQVNISPGTPETNHICWRG